VGGLAPLGLRDGACVSEHRRRALFALSTCFSGGLLMGASLIHLLPGAATINKGSLAEVIGPEEELGGAGGPEENEDYPLSYLLCGAAFLVLMLVDSSLRLCLEHERTDVGLDEMDLEHGDVNQERKENLCPWWQVNTASVAQCRQHGLEMGSSSCSLGAEGTPMGTPRDDEADAAHDFVDTSATMLHGVSDATANPHTSAGEARASHFAYPERAAEQRVDIHPAQAVGNASSSMLSAIATFTAFSFHGLIEGIALGVVGDVRPLFVAVGAHKAFAAFALGTSISRAYFGSGRTLGTPMVTVAVFCFASLTPIGIFLGRRLASGDGDENNTEEYLTSVLTALAAGTFLYVGTIEMLSSELGAGSINRKQSGLVVLKLVAAVFGFVGMAIFALWV